MYDGWGLAFGQAHSGCFLMLASCFAGAAALQGSCISHRSLVLLKSKYCGGKGLHFGKLAADKC